MNAEKNSVAIIIPIYKKDLDENEKQSLAHLHAYLNRYDKYVVKPDNIKFSLPHIKNVSFDSKYFNSVKTYSQLLLSRKFYEKFLNYEYILIYQLDALVFSDKLSEWCDLGYDYAGAPWIKSELSKIHLEYDHEDVCGNGGFSLRKVANFIKVLDSAEISDFDCLKKMICKFTKLIFRFELRPRKYYYDLKEIWTSVPRRFFLNEDFFWSFEAEKYLKNFKIPPVDVGLKFSFEVGPKYCFERNNYELPFGCHAWKIYDEKFWEPYLLNKASYKNFYE